MKRIKKLLITVIILSFGLMTVLLAGCKDYEVIGLENFGDGVIADSLELHYELLPEDMLDKYEYINGDYYFLYPDFFNHKSTVLYLWLEYDEEVYKEAKQYMLDSITYSTKVHYSYNNYEFYENLDFPKRYDRLDENGENEDGLSWFNMICYNDVNRRLMFIGFSSGYNENKYVEKNGWGAFLKKHFSRYNFDE